MSKIFRSVILLYLALLATFTTLMIVVHMIPRSAIQKNFIKSVELFEQEGDYFYLPTFYGSIFMDNFSDCYMHNVAYCVDTSHPVDAAMCNYRYRDNTKMVVSMRHLTDGQLIAKPFEYGKYWHGYLVTLRPLLTIMDYRSIRKLNGIVLALLVTCALVLMWRKLSPAIAICFVVAMVMVHSVVIPWSLQYSTCYYITLTSIILLLKFNRFTSSWRYQLMSFFAIGAFTSFLDFLTTPIMTLGVPLTVVLLNDKTNYQTKLIVGLTLAWGTGYICMWMSKWMLAILLTGYNPLSEVTEHIHLHSVGNTTESVWTMWGKLNDIILTLWTPLSSSGLIRWSIIVAMMGLAIIAPCSRTVIKHHIGLLMVAAITPIWYILVIHHSYTHFPISHRALLVSWFAILCFMCQIIDFKKLKYYGSNLM